MLILTILQAFYFIMKSLHTEGSELYSEYATTWVALFHMTLGEYEVGTTAFTINKQLIKFVTFIRSLFLRRGHYSFSRKSKICPFSQTQRVPTLPPPPPLLYK
jgi:hypothetical protein